jgi:hypothetical protein
MLCLWQRGNWTGRMKELPLSPSRGQADRGMPLEALGGSWRSVWGGAWAMLCCTCWLLHPMIRDVGLRLKTGMQARSDCRNLPFANPVDRRDWGTTRHIHSTSNSFPSWRSPAPFNDVAGRRASGRIPFSARRVPSEPATCVTARARCGGRWDRALASNVSKGAQVSDGEDAELLDPPNSGG